ncbi:MAG TPA: helix-turn-helix domain-containing protein [Burkholderiales bacterium]|jgi:DNA-binding transcriptional regulator YiaG|nr:helix-turn-helix domain-containing protein [Burkholderiales bacterium]
MSFKAKKTPRSLDASDSISRTRLRLRLNLHVRWVWELLDGDNHIVNSSSEDFATRRECELDAKRNGFRPVLKSAAELTNMRRKVGLSQAEFWERVGVTQSGGSRYEQGRVIRKPLRMLLMLAYGSEKERERVVNQLAKLRPAREKDNR